MKTSTSTKEKNEIIEKFVEKLENMTKIQAEMFKNLRAFQVFYNQKIKWFEHEIVAHKQRFVVHLTQKLKKLKKNETEKKYKSITAVKPDWKELLSSKLANIEGLSNAIKEQLKQIIQKKNVSPEEIKIVASILKNLHTNQLIEIFGESFERLTKKYVKWGWEFYEYIKNNMLIAYFNQFEYELKDSLDHEASYTTLEFIEDVRTTLEAILPTFLMIGEINIRLLRNGRLSENKLGTIFGQTDYYIRDIVKPAVKNNVAYLIGQDKLAEFEFNMRSLLVEESLATIRFFEKYRRLNDLPISTKYKIYEKNPQFNKNYFKEIDTIDKAYWLGYIYAEGYVTKRGNYGIKFGVECHVDDRILLDQLASVIGLSEDAVKTIPHRPNMVTLGVHNRDFINNLINLGVVERKSRKLTLPNLGSQELYLAFLLGIFDGDGTMGMTTLTSASKVLLEQIKDKFDLPYKVRHVPGKETGKEVYRISLGGAIFNDMIANYEYSLKRKRTEFEVRRHNIHKQFKSLMTKEKLQGLVWEKSITKIAIDYGVWRHDVASLCKKWEIELPPKGYWNLKENLHLR